MIPAEKLKNRTNQEEASCWHKVNYTFAYVRTCKLLKKRNQSFGILERKVPSYLLKELTNS